MSDFLPFIDRISHFTIYSLFTLHLLFTVHTFPFIYCIFDSLSTIYLLFTVHTSPFTLVHILPSINRSHLNFYLLFICYLLFTVCTYVSITVYTLPFIRCSHFSFIYCSEFTLHSIFYSLSTLYFYSLFTLTLLCYFPTLPFIHIGCSLIQY